jgi:YVTN family beta-propeller protein
MKHTAYILLTALLVVSACRSDKPDVKPEEQISASTGTGVFVTNEGLYQWGNASVSYIHFADNKVTEDVFEAANDRPLGDICQSMELFNGKGYVVVDNSGKIEIVNPSTFQSVGSISGLTSPRYFLGVSTTKAYVTDLFSNSISVVDLTSNTKTKSIPCPGWTEELVLANSKVYVTNVRKKYLYILNTTTDVLQDSIEIGEASNSVKKDKNGKVWVLCSGKINASTAPTLHRINPANDEVELTLTFPLAANPWRLDINGGGDTLYFLNSGVYQFPIALTSLPTSPLIPEGGSLFYGLGIDPHSGVIYVSDAIDYVQKGKVFRYTPSGANIDNFNVGINPGEFCFW